MNDETKHLSSRVVINASAARHDFYELLNRVHFQKKIFLIRRRGKVIAELRGVNQKKYTPPIKRIIDWHGELGE